MNIKTKKVLQYFLSFLLFFAVFFILFNASVNFLIFPFAFGMLFSLAWANQKIWLLAPAYIGAGLLVSPELETAICLLVCVFCLMVPYLIHTLCKKNIRK